MFERYIIVQSPEGDFRRTLFRGLPQGSVLSPILFNFYTIDLHCIFPSLLNVLQYADDFVIYCHHKNINVAAQQMQESLRQLGSWLFDNSLDLSPSKSQIVIFSNKHNLPCIKFDYLGMDIPVRDSVKFLGVVLQLSLIHI